jgi:hypothetical protein
MKILKLVTIGSLPREIREDLYNMHAMFSNPEAVERRFYQKRIPSGTMDISEVIVTNIPEDQLQPFTSVADMPPIVIAQNRLVDGQHRILASRKAGQRTLPYVDASSVIDTDKCGYISELPR